MPKIGLTIEEAEVIEWLATVGDEVAAGQPLVLVNADKTELEIEAPTAGVLAAVQVGPGEVVAVGAVLGSIGIPGAQPADEAPPPVAAAHAPTPAGISSRAPSLLTGPATSRVRASPYARRLAHARGIELRQVRGTGPGGRVVARDVPVTASPSHDGFRASTVRAATDLRLERALSVQRHIRTLGYAVELIDVVVAAVAAQLPEQRSSDTIALGTMLSTAPSFVCIDTAWTPRPLTVDGIVACADQRHAGPALPIEDVEPAALVVLDASETNVSHLEPELWGTCDMTIALGAVEARPVVVRGQFRVVESATMVLVADSRRWTSFGATDLLARVSAEIEHLDAVAGARGG